jgi:exosortase
MAFTRALLFPIAYLLLMIPPPYVLTKSAMTQARLLDAAASAALLRAIGIPVFREANLLHLPNMTLEVADPCSSVLALIALTALAAAYAYMTQRHPVARIVLCLSAFPLAVASNIFRIVILATGVYYAGPIMVHYITEQTYGLINFLVFTLLLAVLGRALMAVFDRALQASERHAS